MASSAHPRAVECPGNLRPGRIAQPAQQLSAVHNPVGHNMDDEAFPLRLAFDNHQSGRQHLLAVGIKGPRPDNDIGYSGRSLAGGEGALRRRDIGFLSV